MARIQLASAVAEFTGGAYQFHLSAATVLQAMQALVKLHPSLSRLFWQQERWNSMVVVMVNGIDCQNLQGLDSPLADSDELMVISALEGG